MYASGDALVPRWARNVFLRQEIGGAGSAQSPLSLADGRARCACEGSPVMTGVERSGVAIDVCPQ